MAVGRLVRVLPTPTSTYDKFHGGGVTTVNVCLSEALTGSEYILYPGQHRSFGSRFRHTDQLETRLSRAAEFEPAARRLCSAGGNAISVAAWRSAQLPPELVANSSGFSTPTSTAVNGATTTNLFLLGSYSIHQGTQPSGFNLTDLSQSQTLWIGRQRQYPSPPMSELTLTLVTTMVLCRNGYLHWR